MRGKFLSIVRAIAFFFVATESFAGPAASLLFDVVQPDGGIFRGKTVGDEVFNYIMTEDGFVVAEDVLGFYSYADENGEGSGIYVHNVERRTEKEIAFLQKVNTQKVVAALEAKRPQEKEEMSFFDSPVPQGVRMLTLAPGEGALLAAPMTNSSFTIGTKRVLVVLMEFQDQSFSRTNPVADYNDFYNKKGYNKYGNIGSVRDYFWKNSNGLLDLQFDIQAPVKLSKKKADYGNRLHSTAGAKVAIIEALDSLEKSGNVDFSKYDNDGDGRVDFVVAIHAGTDAAGGVDKDAIWAHKGSLAAYANTSQGKIYFYQYACVGELNIYAYRTDRATKTLEGVGMIAHEFSHMLGLMDIYDTEAAKVVVRAWDLMDYGNYSCKVSGVSGCTPPYYSAFEKMYLGWLTPTVIEDMKKYTLKPINENEAFKINSPEKDENDYYLMEYRTHKDYDAAQSTHGMLIWKIRFNKMLWNWNSINANGDRHVDIVRIDDERYGGLSTPVVFPGVYGLKEYSGFYSKQTSESWVRVTDVEEASDSSSVSFVLKSNKPEDQISSSSAVEFESSSSEESSSSVKSSSSAKSSSSSVNSSSSLAKSSSSSVNSSSSVKSSSSSLVNSSSSVMMTSSSFFESSSSLIMSKSSSTMPNSSQSRSSSSRVNMSSSSNSYNVKYLESSTSVSEKSSSSSAKSSSSVANKVRSSSSVEDSSDSKSSSSKNSVRFVPVEVNVHKRILDVYCATSGVKTVSVFNMNGANLFSKTFTQSSTQIELPESLHNTKLFVLVKVDGRIVKTYRNLVF